MAENARGKMQSKTFHKDFDGWARLAKKLDKNQKTPTIREGEVWWCNLGANIATEICGKGSTYSRPVLVFRKLSRYDFMGVPLTSKIKVGSWYVGFEFLNKQQTAVIGQARVMSTSRLYKKMGQVPKSDLDEVRECFIALFG